MDVLNFINRIEGSVIKEINEQFPPINYYSSYDELINELSKKVKDKYKNFIEYFWFNESRVKKLTFDT